MRNLVRSSVLGAAILTATFLIPPQTGVRAGNSLLLRYHWTVGQHDTVSTVSSQKVSMVFPKMPAINQDSVEVDRYNTTLAVTKVFPDGSGLVHLTFAKVSVTKDGKTTTYPLRGYALELRVSTIGKVISKTTIGSASTNLPSDITDPTPFTYPQAAVSIGGSWTQSQTISGMGVMTMQLKLLSFGTTHGRQTATVAVTANQPMHLTTGGLTLSGSLLAKGTQTMFVDTGIGAAANHLAMSLNGTMSGTVQGTQLSGTMTLSSTQDDVPQS